MKDARRSVCDELAELLTTEEGLRTARLLQLSETLSADRPVVDAETVPEAVPEAVPENVPDSPRPISIWQPRRQGEKLFFERPEPLPLGDHYAQRRTLEVEKVPGSARICLFGESVAAGYLYAPHLTPAQVLERRLRSVAVSPAAGETAYEVIDLARTNETMDSMRATIEASLQLDPDLLVIFAGNNWNLLETPAVSPYVPSIRSRQRFALALRRAGLAGPVELARRQLDAKAEELFAAIARWTRRRMAVIVVVPEVNLADWHDRQPVVWLPADGSRRWHQSYLEATEHLAQERYETALEVADSMLELDDGRCPTTHRVRSIALAALGRPGEARRAGEAEVESGCYATQAFLGAPRAAASVREILRRACERHGFAIVDLPRLFEQHLAEDDADSALPGRRLFLDYCHLSAEGIEVAMAAVAAEVSRCRGAPPPLAGATPEVATPEVAPAVEALARLGAAIHGAHRLLTVGEKRQILEHWCRQALVADPAIADAMSDFLIARCAPGPAVLTAAQQRNLESPHRLLLQHGWRWDHLDAEVTLALCATLDEAGLPIRDRIDALLLQHHAVTSKGVDLTRPPYLWEPLERFFPEAMAARGFTGRATYRSPWPESSFCLIADTGQSIALALTARLPRIEGAVEHRRGEITVRLNGHEIGSVTAGETWAREVLRLPGHRLRRALNRLTLVWPPLPALGEEAIEAAIRRLENGLEADLHPVFGEVFSLQARRADQGARRSRWL